MGDGLAFVIQNAIGSGSDPDPYLTSANTGSAETGSGLSVISGGGGGMGYGRIDNSIALEADTFDDSYDPWDYGTNYYNGNHMAMQSLPTVRARPKFITTTRPWMSLISLEPIFPESKMVFSPDSGCRTAGGKPAGRFMVRPFCGRRGAVKATDFC